MSGNVIELRSPTRPIAQFVRIGSAHRKLGELQAAGRLPVRRVVIEAARFTHQKELIDVFRRDAVEIVLDPQVAELAALEKASGVARNAPWAQAAEGGLLGPAFFQSGSKVDVVSQIARFAVENAVDTVLTPTHFIADPQFNGWFAIDRAACIALRRALDREGGSSIAIDYPVIHSHVALNDQAIRSDIQKGLEDLPIDNVWIRPSGLGNEPKPLATRQFITSMSALHNLGKPVIIDFLDGMLGQAVLAFGAASGLAHGIGEQNQFDARSWHKEPKQREEGAGFGRTIYVPIPGLGRSVSRAELELLASARGGKRAVACQDACCAHGVADMSRDHRQHAARQAFACVEVLAGVPDMSRERFFLDKPLREAEKLARTIKDLRPSEKDAERLGVNLESLSKRMADHHERIVKLEDALGHFHDSRGKSAPRAKACEPRNSHDMMNSENAR